MSVHLTAYPEYRDSGIPWTNQIPTHWKSIRAKQLFSKESREVTERDEVVTCFRDGTVTLRKNRRLRGFTEALKEIGYQGVRRGDLVIHAMDAFAGAVGVSDSDGKCSPVCSVCRPRQGANPHYYAFVIREMSRSLWILALSKGIRERSTDFRFDDFGGQTVPVPPPEEQTAIVKYLDHADQRIRQYIAAKRRLIALLSEQKQALIHRAVTRGLDPAAPLRPSGIPWLGDIPAHWEVKRIGQMARVGNGSTPSRGNMDYWDSGTYPWLNSSHVNRGYIDSSDQFVTEQALAECHLPKVPPNSILIAITGQGKTRGTSAVLGIEATINQHLAYITPISGVFPRYLHCILTAAYGALRNQSDDSGSTKGALTCGELKCFKITVPPFAEQEAIVVEIAASTATLDAAIATARREIDLLREYRTRLIADVVTGKLDVRAAAAALPDLPADSAGDTDTPDTESAEADESESEIEPVAEEA